MEQTQVGREGQAADLINAGRHDLAMRLLVAQMAETPASPRAHQLLAHCLRLRKDFRESLAEAEEAIRLDPEDAWSYLELGWTLDSLGRPFDARRAIEEAVGMAPREPAAFAALSGILLETAKPADAIAAATSGLAVDPRHAGCLAALARALLRRGEVVANKREASQAYDVMRLALSSSPQVAAFHINLGRALAHLGAYEQAATEYLEALGLQPDSQEARQRLHGLYAAQFLWRPGAGLTAFGYAWFRRSGRVRAVISGGLVALGLAFGGAWGVLYWVLAAETRRLKDTGTGRFRTLAASVLSQTTWRAGLLLAIAATTVVQGAVFGAPIEFVSAHPSPGAEWVNTAFMATLQVVGGLLAVYGAFPSVQLAGRMRRFPAALVAGGTVATVICSPLLPAEIVGAALRVGSILFLAALGAGIVFGIVVGLRDDFRRLLGRLGIRGF
jgi:Flp pilus assembly protein TadD